MITYTNQLDICPGGVPLFIKLSQYDSNFSLVFNLFSHKGTFTVESGTTALFRETKPDGNVISLDASVNGAVVTFTPTADQGKQITAIAGACLCEIVLKSGQKDLGTANFTILVEKAPVDQDAIPSDSILRELYDVADRADEILEAAEIVEQAVEDFETLIDPTLTQSGKAAEAKATGDRLSAIELLTDNFVIDSHGYLCQIQEV